MRIQYSRSLFLSVFVIASACQHGADRLYMDGNGGPATKYAKEKNRASLTPSEAIVSEARDTNTQNGHGTILPATSSRGSLATTAQSGHALQPHGAVSEAKPSVGVTQRQGEKKEEVSQASPDHEAWFQRFVDAVDHAEEWVEIAGVLAEGGRHGYLDKSVVWDDDQYTPLHYAAEEGDLEVVKELIEKYQIPVDIRTSVYQRTPLHLAALKGYLEVVQYLIDRSADINAVDSAVSNALHYASSGIKGHQNTEIVKFLIEDKHADYKSLANNEFSLLYLAIKAANIDLVRYTADQFPDLLSMTTCSVSPLAFAQYKHEAEIVAIIQQKLQEKKLDPCEQLSKNCNIC